MKQIKLKSTGEIISLEDYSALHPLTSFAVGEYFTPLDDAEVEEVDEPVEVQSLDDAKNAKYVEINEARMAATYAGFTFKGKQIATDILSRSDIDATNGYVALFGTFQDDWPGGWKTIDNSYVEIKTVDDWKDFYKAMVAQGNMNFSKAQSLKSTISKATDVETVNNFHW